MKPCYKCGSTRWDCIDEHDVTCTDTVTGEEYRAPEDWIKCRDCGTTWCDGGCDAADEEVDEERE